MKAAQNSMATWEPATSARKLKHCLVASVLPAPDSPEMRIACSPPRPPPRAKEHERQGIQQQKRRLRRSLSTPVTPKFHFAASAAASSPRVIRIHTLDAAHQLLSPCDNQNSKTKKRGYQHHPPPPPPHIKHASWRHAITPGPLWNLPT